MPIQIETRADHLHVHWSGAIVAADLGRLFGELPTVAARCAFTPHVLHTVEASAELKADPLEAFTYSKRRIVTPIPDRVRAAFVAHAPAAVAIARNFENFNRNPHLTIKSFLHETEALNWLLERTGHTHPSTDGSGGPTQKEP